MLHLPLKFSYNLIMQLMFILFHIFFIIFFLTIRLIECNKTLYIHTLRQSLSSIFTHYKFLSCMIFIYKLFKYFVYTTWQLFASHHPIFTTTTTTSPTTSPTRALYLYFSITFTLSDINIHHVLHI